MAAQFITQTDYARLRGVSKSWVSQLKAAGRLVLNEQGLVDVEASDRKIAETDTLDNPGVAQRWEEHRASAGQPHKASTSLDGDVAAESLRKSKAVSAHFDALKKKLEYQTSIRELVPAADARAAAVDLGTRFRIALDRLDVLAPELAAASDEARVLALLADAREEILTNLATQLERAAHQLGGPAT